MLKYIKLVNALIIIIKNALLTRIVIKDLDFMSSLIISCSWSISPYLKKKTNLTAFSLVPQWTTCLVMALASWQLVVKTTPLFPFTTLGLFSVLLSSRILVLVVSVKHTLMAGSIQIHFTWYWPFLFLVILLLSFSFLGQDSLLYFHTLN